MAESRKINYKNIFFLIFFMIMMLLSYLYWDNLKINIRNFLEFKILYFILFGLTLLIFILSYITNTQSSNKSSFIGSSFGRFFDTVINGLTYGAAISSSLTLIKGFYIQKIFEDKIYFLEFSNIDVWLLFLTMCFLLYFCVERVIVIVKELIWITESIEIDNT